MKFITNFQPEDLPTYEKSLEKCKDRVFKIEKFSHDFSISSDYSLWGNETDIGEFWRVFDEVRKEFPTKMEKQFKADVEYEAIKASEQGKTLEDCPYPKNSNYFDWWCVAFIEHSSRPNKCKHFSISQFWEPSPKEDIESYKRKFEQLQVELQIAATQAQNLASDIEKRRPLSQQAAVNLRNCADKWNQLINK